MSSTAPATVRPGAAPVALAALGPPVPGAVVVWEANAPAYRVIQLAGRRRARIHLGATVELDTGDRSTGQVTLARTGGGWSVCPRGGEHDVSVDGHPVRAGTPFRASGSAVLSLGSALVLLTPDVRPHLAYPLRVEDGHILGPHTRMAHGVIARAARGGSSLLILGETGVGKELAARVYHRHARHRTGKFVALNGANLEPANAECRLFGAAKGSFTGSVAPLQGLIPMAHGGTLFLDEIAELPQDVQSKLLRVLQDGEYHQLGDPRAHFADVREVGATHPTLSAARARGGFRDDLYHRIAHRKAHIPPLRERREDIPWLVALEAARAFRNQDEPPRPLHPHLVRASLLRPWREGNVRELASVVGTAVENALGEGAAEVLARHVPEPDGAERGARRTRDVNAAAIREELRRQNGDRTATARALGISRATLYRRLAEE